MRQLPVLPVHRLCSRVSTHLPLSESEFLLSSALGLEALLLLKGPADGASGNGEVAVVAICARRPVRVGQTKGARDFPDGGNSRKTGGFPGEHHFDGLGSGELKGIGG